MALIDHRALFRALATLIMLALLPARPAAGLEAGSRSLPKHFGVVGSFALTRAELGSGFTGVQVAPRWVLTAAHAAPPVGSIFVDDFGMSGVAAVLTFPSKAPSQAPLTGALRDDLALVRLSAPIASPYFPRLADDTALPRQGALMAAAYSTLQTTLVSNNPSMAARRFGPAHFQGLLRAPGYDFLLVTSDKVGLVGGDSGSPAFLGQLNDTDRESVLAGVATAQGKRGPGASLGIYTRVGPYRALLDAAVEASGEKLRWYAAPPATALSSRNEESSNSKGPQR
jgi:hypothetical protein